MGQTGAAGDFSSEKSKRLEIPHPLISKSLHFRYLYAYGVAVLALGSMKSITELKQPFQSLLNRIALPKKQTDQLIVDINNHFEKRLTECIDRLNTKKVQYCFLTDLYLLSACAVWSEEYCTKVIENYFQIFHASEPEIAFFNEFNEAAVAGDVARAKEISHQFRDSGFEISYQTLQYFFPDFEDEDNFNDITVKAGKTFFLDKPTKVRGDIVVERGGSLLLSGAKVVIDGSVTVDGGRIRFRDSSLFVESCAKDVLLTIENAAVVRMENAVINCNYRCGFLTQNSGQLLIKDSRFLRSNRKRMIDFTGMYAQFLQTTFSEGESGFVRIGASARVRIEDCRFIQAYDEYGGAIFSDSIGSVTVDRSAFTSCRAKYLGAAVCFHHQKLGQVVKDCTFQQCNPQDDAVFNADDTDDFLLSMHKTDRREYDC